MENKDDMPDVIVLGHFYAPAPMSEWFYAVLDETNNRMIPAYKAKYLRADKLAKVREALAPLSNILRLRGFYIEANNVVEALAILDELGVE